MILLVGNCQLQRLFFILTKISCIADVRYLANTEAIDEAIDFNTVISFVRAADMVIAQPIFNPMHPLFFERLKAENSNTFFVPYIFVDGFFSMSAADNNITKIYGGQFLLQHADPTMDIGYATDEFLSGRVCFENIKRFDASIEELRSREKVCSIVVSDWIVDTYSYLMPLISHNHPAPELFDIYCLRLGKVTGLPIKPLGSLSAKERVEYIFGRARSTFSPYDAKALGVSYGYDDYWAINGISLIQRMAELRLAEQCIYIK